MTAPEPEASPNEAPASSASVLVRLLQLAWATALIGLPLGLAIALADVRPYPRRFELLPLVIDIHVGRGLLFAGAALLVWLGSFAALGRAAPQLPARWRARLAAFAPWLYAEVSLVGWANRELLPGLSDPVRGVIHASIAIALLATVELASRRLLTWRERSWLPGRRPPLAGLAIATMLVLAIGVMGLQRGPVDDRPNVIVILLDVLGARHLGTYGYERSTSPNMDAFAEESVVFEQAISQSSFTKTSISSLFTSLYPYRHGVYRGGSFTRSTGIESDVLDPSHTTLAEAFRDAGYFTMAWVQNSQIRAFMGFDQGFELYREGRGHLHRMMRDVMPWFEHWAPRLRFYAYMHVIDIHAPYEPATAYAEKLGATEDRFRGMKGKEYHGYRRAVNRREIEIGEGDARLLRTLYDAEIAAVDAKLGELFDLLKRKGLYDEAVIVIAGDHGEAFMQHGRLGHSSTPYDELIHVPLIVKLPGSQHAGRRVAEPVALVDVGPTLLDVVGADPAEGTDGVSQVARLTGGTANDDAATRPIVSEFEDCIAIRTAAWKYLSCEEKPAELYHLAGDPGETTNVIDGHPEIAAGFAERADAIRELRATTGERVTIDPETIEALEALGYL